MLAEKEERERGVGESGERALVRAERRERGGREKKERKKRKVEEIESDLNERERQREATDAKRSERNDARQKRHVVAFFADERREAVCLSFSYCVKDAAKEEAREAFRPLFVGCRHPRLTRHGNKEGECNKYMKEVKIFTVADFAVDTAGTDTAFDTALRKTTDR
uniref:Uncharacterized protein n=1 Tax=Toxoplasma gondii COUG TaxID=1074873 RepID=A0A2G8XND4_TOXGO|nr:hypothetical protein TGCOUG_395640 [Toxoplasma gondii COUG]